MFTCYVDFRFIYIAIYNKLQKKNTLKMYRTFSDAFIIVLLLAQTFRATQN